MIESIKTRIWELLKKKDVSLAMIFSQEGDILWHRGRSIKGKNIEEGEGFSKSSLRQSVQNGKTCELENVAVVGDGRDLPESALILNIKNLVVLPICRGFFLYLDSGVKDSFSDTDREICKILGELLGDMIDKIREREKGSGGITGESEEINRVRELVLKYSLEEDPVLIHGETGSGKNHIAELIHRYSGRKGKFVTIHTPGIPENLFESEVFGHKKGAFTDARSDKMGLVEEAAGGTLFFDEIAEVPPSFQARLLRFIETKRYFALGATVEKQADVRIIASTNRELGKAIKAKRFREDLYFRLQVLEIRLPSIRERMGDIKTLVLEESETLRGKKIGKGFWEAVQGHDWPGNIRELKSVLKRAGILSGDTVYGKDILEIIEQSSIKNSLPTDEIMTISEKIWQEIKDGKNFWQAVKEPFLDREISRDQVKGIIRRGLSEVGGRYIDLVSFFHLIPADYHRFMTFLSDYRLKEGKS